MSDPVLFWYGIALMEIGLLALAFTIGHLVGFRRAEDRMRVLWEALLHEAETNGTVLPDDLGAFEFWNNPEDGEFDDAIEAA